MVLLHFRLSISDTFESPGSAISVECRLDGRTVVIRLACNPWDHPFVHAEVSTLAALQTLQGSHVPRMLEHGTNTEGYAYVITEFIAVSLPLELQPAFGRSSFVGFFLSIALGANRCQHHTVSGGWHADGLAWTRQLSCMLGPAAPQ